MLKFTFSGEHTGDDAVYKCHVSPDDGETFYIHSVELNVLGMHRELENA